jgi:hypothetical protein
MRLSVTSAIQDTPRVRTGLKRRGSAIAESERPSDPDIHLRISHMRKGFCALHRKANND